MKKLFTLVSALTLVAFAFTANAQNLIFTVNSPGGISGDYVPGNPNGFTGQLAPGESLTGDLTLTSTGDPDSLINLQGCDTIMNVADVTGKIAMINRGTCFFQDKVYYGQLAGAIGVVICNNAPGAGVIDFGTGGTFIGLDTIPSCMLSWDDCQILLAEMEAGNVVNITMRVPAFYGGVSSYSYHTPETQILPIDVFEVNLVNAEDSDVTNVEVSVDITDPDGNVTSFTETLAQIPAGFDTLVSFSDEYLPTVLGEYTVLFSNSLYSDVIERKFVITEDVWAPDNGTISGSAGPSAAQFATNDSYKYYYGSLQLTGEAPAIATHISFGIANATTVFVNNPDFDLITAVLYDGDEDGDQTLNWASTGASFDDLKAIAIGNYAITGAEDPNALIMVELTSVVPGSTAVDMKENGAFYASIQYNGDATLAVNAPAFLSTDDVPYLNFPTTPLYLEQLYTGWAGEIVVCRLHIDATVDAKEVSRILDKDKVTLLNNPADELLIAQFNLVDLAEEVRADIINYDGKVVGTYYFNNVQDSAFDINVSSLTNGYYFLSVKTPEGWRSVPFVVQH